MNKLMTRTLHNINIETTTKTIMTVTLLSAMSLAQANNIAVSDCVIQQVIPPKNMTGAFMTIDNQGSDTLEIVSATLPSVTNTVELHEMKVVDNVMMMQEISSYELTPGKHEFKKGGYHVMLMDIKDSPQVGEEHQLTLNLSNGEEVACQALVMSVDEVMAKYHQTNVKHGHQMTPWQMQMANQQSVEQMNEHHQSDVMPDLHDQQGQSISN